MTEEMEGAKEGLGSDVAGEEEEGGSAAGWLAEEEEEAAAEEEEAEEEGAAEGEGANSRCEKERATERRRVRSIGVVRRESSSRSTRNLTLLEYSERTSGEMLRKEEEEEAGEKGETERERERV